MSVPTNLSTLNKQVAAYINAVRKDGYKRLDKKCKEMRPHIKGIAESSIRRFLIGEKSDLPIEALERLVIASGGTWAAALAFDQDKPLGQVPLPAPVPTKVPLTRCEHMGHDAKRNDKLRQQALSEGLNSYTLQRKVGPNPPRGLGKTSCWRWLKYEDFTLGDEQLDVIEEALSGLAKPPPVEVIKRLHRRPPPAPSQTKTLEDACKDLKKSISEKQDEISREMEALAERRSEIGKYNGQINGVAILLETAKGNALMEDALFSVLAAIETNFKS